MEPPVQRNGPGVFQRLVEILPEVIEGDVVISVQVEVGPDDVEILFGAELGEPG